MSVCAFVRISQDDVTSYRVAFSLRSSFTRAISAISRRSVELGKVATQPHDFTAVRANTSPPLPPRGADRRPAKLQERWDGTAGQAACRPAALKLDLTAFRRVGRAARRQSFFSPRVSRFALYISYEYPVISQLRGAASTRNPRAAAFIQCLEVASPIPNAFFHNLRHCLSVCLTDSKTHKFTSRFS